MHVWVLNLSIESNCDPIDYRPPDFSVCGFLQAEYWRRLYFLLRALPDRGIELSSPALAGEFFTIAPPGRSVYIYTDIFSFSDTFPLKVTRRY